MELILVRHALPNREERTDGSRADPSLSADGRRQAERLADWFRRHPVDVLYSSPLRRAAETAEPVARVLGLTPRIAPGVSEFDRDAAVYIPMEELKQTDYATWKQFVDGGYGDQVDFESFRRGVVECLEAIIAENPSRRVAVFCHGGVINTWAASVLGLAPRLFFDAGYTSVNRFLAATSGERSLVSLNELAHLEDAEADAGQRL
ncbi:MAG: histidine phosphatase family protein [Myxococcota bacterium]